MFASRSGYAFRPRHIVQGLTLLIMLAWPGLIWFGLTYGGLPWLLPPMVLLLALRAYYLRHQAGPMQRVLLGIALAGITLCIASALFKAYQLLLFYPVMVNLVMLTLFAGSLWSTMPLVERLARLRHVDLPTAGVRYTRKVTHVWCLFFILNGSMALFTALLGNLALWTLWNGMLAYLLMGILMAGEWLVRCRVMKQAVP